jgi:hypothetical protein
VPDLQDRAVYGVGSVVGLGANSTDGKTAGNRGGPFHHHAFSKTTSSDGGHSHNFSAMQQQFDGQVGGSTQYGVVGTPETRQTDTAKNHSHSVSGDTTGGYGQDAPSFAGMMYVITTGRASA